MNRFSYQFPILTYHRVGPARHDHVPTVSGQAFERQLSFLAKRRFRVLSLDECIACLDRGIPLPRHSVAVTFDDGYEETYSVAWPILQRFGFPAAVFITPTEVGQQGFISWEQASAMATDGMTIGSHTMHHSYLPLVPEERLAEELIESKRVIEARVGRSVDYISYPIGGFTPRAQAVIKQAGYRAAYTTNRLARPGGFFDRYALRRIKVTERDAHPLVFLVKLSGYYDLFRQLKESS